MNSLLKKRHLLTLMNHSKEEIEYLLVLAEELKDQKQQRTETHYLKNRNIALIFEKTSTRTRCAFEVAAYDQGAHVTYLDPVGSQIGHKESIADTARVLGRFYDAIEYRGSAHSIVETLAEYAGVPVFNGLTDDYHPTQSLADVMTMKEHTSKALNEIVFSYVGDAANNVSNSLLIIAAKLGMTMKIGAPKKLWPNPVLFDQCQEMAKISGAKLLCFEDPAESVRDTDFIYTDVWLSMGAAKEWWAERIDLLFPYQVNQALMNKAMNPSVKFMHCLPAFHDHGTTEGQKLIERFPQLKDGFEVTHDVFESPAAIVFDQAENRLHSIKAIMVASLY